jgi:ABC-type sugar transport system ATPase subunit
MASVRFKDVDKRYGGVHAVIGVSLDIADGEFMVLVGPSGSGKTTALRMLAGLESISGGEILIGDEVVNRRAPRDRDIAMVFQDYALYPQMTVFDNLAFGLRRRKVPKDEIAARVARAAAALDLERYLKRKPGQLSGGQAQRVALGRALVREPQVFLMDEPLSNLDAKLRTQTRGEIKRLQQEVRTTTVYVTHDQVEAMTMGDRIAVMNEGRLEQVGTPEELYERPANRFVAGFIGSPAMSFFEASVVRDGAAGARLRCGGLELPVAAAVADGLPDTVTVGVRPECAKPWQGGHPGLAGPFGGRVSYVEALGRETFVGIAVDGAELVVHHDGRAALLPGDAIEFGVAPAGLRFFAPDSGLAIPAGGARPASAAAGSSASPAAEAAA